MKSNSFGLKEVADVYLFDLGATGVMTSGIVNTVAATMSGSNLVIKIGDKVVVDEGATPTTGEIAPTYGFDSLKVSNIEVTSEETTANGGKGNPELISWSYGKAATFTIEDALVSTKTFNLLFGVNEGTNATTTMTVDANTFPDPYLIIGKTVMRSYATGKDEPFVFVIPKAKVNIESTFTMEADGDPSTFEMVFKALSATIGGKKDVLVQFLKPTLS